MSRHSLSKQVVRVSLLSGLALHLVWGCSDSTDEKIRAAELAQGCSINSDCRDPLVCAFERCHVACNEDRDCPDELRCVLGSGDGANVCQLPDEVDCDGDKDCPGDQVCGVDEECRDQCDRDGDCVDGQICAASNECASTLPEKDRLDENGNILPDDVSGAGGSDGAGASGGSDGSGGSGNQTGSSAGEGGTNSSGEGGSGGQIIVGSGGEGGDPAPDGEGGAGASPDAEYEETSDGVETVENNDREHPVPLVATASIFLTTGDEDWFKVETPNDGRAHVITLRVQQQADLRTAVRALAASDFAEIGMVPLAKGTTSNVFVTAGPGTTTLIQFAPYGSSEKPDGKRVELSLEVRAEDDVHEPNNTRETATPISLDTDVSAQVMIPFVSATDQVATDWYSVSLEAGAANVSITTMPNDGRLRIWRYNSENVSSLLVTLVEGQTGDFDFTVAEAGTYYFAFERYIGFEAFTSGVEPENLSQSYTFQIQQ